MKKKLTPEARERVLKLFNTRLTDIPSEEQIFLSRNYIYEEVNFDKDGKTIYVKNIDGTYKTIKN